MKKTWLPLLIFVACCYTLILTGCEEDMVFGFFSPKTVEENNEGTFTPSTASTYESLADIIKLYPGAMEDKSDEAKMKAEEVNGIAYYTEDPINLVEDFYDKEFKDKKKLDKETGDNAITYTIGHSSGNESIPDLSLHIGSVVIDREVRTTLLLRMFGKKTLASKLEEQSFYSIEPNASVNKSVADIIQLYPGAKVDKSVEALLKASKANGIMFYTEDNIQNVETFYDKALAEAFDFEKEKTQGIVSYSFGHSGSDNAIPKANITLMNTSPGENSSVNILVYINSKDMEWNEQEFYKVEGYEERP